MQGVKARGKKKRWGIGDKAATVHTRNVPVELRAQFKAYCGRRQYTMEAAVIALMRKAIREDLALPDARIKKMNVDDGTMLL